MEALSPMNALALSVCLPFVGPALIVAARGVPRAGYTFMSAVDKILMHKILMLCVAVILVGSVLPLTYRSLGLPAVMYAAAGFVLAMAAGRSLTGQVRKSRSELLIFAALGGFLVHSLADGAALFSFSDSHVAIGPAIILDRCSMGLFIWWMLQPRFGKAFGLLALLLVGLATAAGYFLMAHLSSALSSDSAIALLQSVLIGVVAYLAVDHKRICTA